MAFNFSYRNPYDNIELNLYTCGHEACKSLHSYGPAIRSGYLIHIVLRGKGTYKINNTEYTLSAGDAFLIYPNELIYYEADKDDPWEYIWVGLVGTKVCDYLNKTSISKSNPIFTIRNDSSLILNEFPNTSNNNKNTQQTYLDEALLYIQLNFHDNISIIDIATHLSIDRSYLHRIFKKNLNISPQEYILNLRLEKAAELLSTTSLTIGDISRSVGYNDTMLFSKTFKKYNVCTPSLYRKFNNHI